MPVGEVGELCLRGPHVCAGYWNNPRGHRRGARRRRLVPHRRPRAARRGRLLLHRRAPKDMLISGGVNVYPAEIEGELLLHPAVRDAAVVGVPDATWGEVGVAFVVAGGRGYTDRRASGPRLRRHGSPATSSRRSSSSSPRCRARLRQGGQGGAGSAYARIFQRIRGGKRVSNEDLHRRLPPVEVRQALGMTVPEIVARRGRRRPAPRSRPSRPPSTSPRSAPPATSPSTSRGCSPGWWPTVPGLAGKPIEAVENACASGGQAILSVVAEAAARPRRRRHRGRLREDARRRGQDGRQADRQGARLLLPPRRAGRQGLRLPAPLRRGDAAYMATHGVTEEDLAGDRRARVRQRAGTTPTRRCRRSR